MDAALDQLQTSNWERSRMEVENSARLGEIETTNGDKAEEERLL
jgi:hypothetical protein